MKIHIYPSLLVKLDLLSSEYNIEIGGYLTGEVKEGEIILEDLLIPSQSISAVSVEISPKHQIELLRKYGSEKCKKILGHWHSHHKMGTFWSGTDRNNMENIMDYKPLFLFVVSSNKKHLVRVCLRNPIRLDIEEVELNIKSLSIDILKNQVNKLISSQTQPLEEKVCIKCGSALREVEDSEGNFSTKCILCENITLGREEVEKREESYYG